MVERIRLFSARLLLVVLAVGGVWMVAGRESASAPGLILGRYTGRYFLLLVLAVVAAVGLLVFVFQPAFRQLIEAERHRGKWAILGGWCIAAPLLYGATYALMPSTTLRTWWNSAAAWAFSLLTLFVFLVTFDALQEAVRRPEFYLVLGSLLIATILAEFGLRIYLRNQWTEQSAQEIEAYFPEKRPRALQRFTPHPYLIFVNNPAWRSEDGQDLVNSLGYRGEEVAVPKPAGTYRIVAIGGSTTFGTGVDQWEDAYPAQLEQVLIEDYGYNNVEVINAGVGGYNSWETLINLEFRVLDLEPDLVILYQNTNDIHARIVPPDLYRSDNTARRHPWIGQAVQRNTRWQDRIPSTLWRYIGLNFRWFQVEESITLDDVVSNNCSGFLATEECLEMTQVEALEANPPIYYERNIRLMETVSRQYGAEMLMLTWAHTDAYDDYTQLEAYQLGFTEHNEVMRRVAEDVGAYFYDFAADMPMDQQYWSDGRHMTASGNRLRAELIARYLDQAGVIPHR